MPKSAHTDNLPFPVTVCGWGELDQFCNQDITHILCMLDPFDPPAKPDWFAGIYRRLSFSDIYLTDVPNTTPPALHHVEAIIEFGRRCRDDAEQQPVHLLVHCFAGISRSSAAALIIIADLLGQEHANILDKIILNLRPQALPNPRMIDFGDRLLGWDGALNRISNHIRTGQFQSFNFF